jgi:hypothetical protein
MLDGHDAKRFRMRRVHPCVFGAEVDARAPVNALADGLSLDDYMTLPVDQYAPNRYAMFKA